MPGRSIRRQHIVLAILILVAFVTAIRWQVLPLLRERQAVATLRGAGAIVVFSDERKRRKTLNSSNWLRQVFGDEVLADVETVSFINTATTKDEDVWPLTHLPNLRYASVGGQTFTDRGARILATVPSLRGINFWNAAVTGDGIRALRPCRDLEVLSLAGSAVTDHVVAGLAELPSITDLQLVRGNLSSKGLQSVASMKKLRRLDLWQPGPIDNDGIRALAGSDIERIHVIRMPWTDQTMKACRGWQSLRHIKVVGAQITKVGLGHLASLKNLQSISLTGGTIGDADLQPLTALTHLQSLDLSETQITNAVIVHLLQLKLLEELDISRTGVTDAAVDGLISLQLKRLKVGEQISQQGVERLRKGLPNCSFELPLRSNQAAPGLPNQN